MTAIVREQVKPAVAPARVTIGEEFGWCRWQGNGRTVWFAGYIAIGGRTIQRQEAARHLAQALNGDPDQLAAALRRLDGHFAVIVEEAARLIAATDRIRSFPLFYMRQAGGFILDSRARRLLASSSHWTLDQDGGLAVAMSGYTAGPATLYSELKQVEAGSLAVFAGGDADVRRYYTYDSWKEPERLDRPAAKRRHGEVVRQVFEKLVAGLDGRAVMAPLSGGLDSRLVVAGLCELGYRNVVCFSYGRPGNHEAERARQVAEKLGLPWHFVSYSPAKVRALQASDLFAEHYRFADTCASVPFIQDLLAIDELRTRNLVPADAIFINGQSGDFITGNHVPETLRQPRPELDQAKRRDRITDALIAKHFSLWQDLKTPDNLARIAALLNQCIEAAKVPTGPASADHGIYELVEFQERQSKFVVSGQRVYDFFGYDWRLPLWDVDYIDFWERMPLEFKIGQNLYQEWLAESDWGGVWSPLLPKRTIVPRGARYARAAVSVPVKLFGRQAWKNFDRRVFTHLTDVLCVASAAPWSRALFDRRGFRQGVAFRCENYLQMHGVSADGQTRTGGPPLD